jgi:hypothetical protein
MGRREAIQPLDIPVQYIAYRVSENHGHVSIGVTPLRSQCGAAQVCDRPYRLKTLPQLA